MTNPADSAARSFSRSALRSVARWTRRLLGAGPEQTGSSSVETAIALPLYFTIVFGCAQYALVLLTYCNATYACRLASRYASMHSSSSLAPDTVAQIQGLVTSRLFVGPAIAPTVSVSYCTLNLSPGANIVGNVVEVSVTWNQTVKLPLIPPSSFSVGTQNYKVITR
jgi:Flp pilus assembly protein TadG